MLLHSISCNSVYNIKAFSDDYQLRHLVAALDTLSANARKQFGEDCIVDITDMKEDPNFYAMGIHNDMSRVRLRKIPVADVKSLAEIISKAEMSNL